MLGGLGATLATSASASTLPGTVTANTHLNNHPDTTDISGGAILPGNVWAYDNATEKFTAVPVAGQVNTWSVTMDYVGSFHGFADPKTGAALDSNGSIKGTISFTVISHNTPDSSRLPGQSASDAHISDNIKALFRDPNATILGGDAYTFSYQNGNYVQVGAPTPGTTGNVTGH